MSTPQPKPRYWLRFAVGIGAYLLLVALQAFLPLDAVPRYLLVPLALVPLVPAAYGLVAWLRALAEFDELQRRIQSEAGLFALGMTALSSFGYGFLESYAGFPRLSTFVILPLLTVTYLIGTARAQWRYR